MLEQVLLLLEDLEGLAFREFGFAGELEQRPEACAGRLGNEEVSSVSRMNAIGGIDKGGILFLCRGDGGAQGRADVDGLPALVIL